MIKPYKNYRPICSNCELEKQKRRNVNIDYYKGLFALRKGFRRFYTNICDSKKSIEHPKGKIKMFFVDYHPDGRRVVGKIHFQHLVYRTCTFSSTSVVTRSDGGPHLALGDQSSYVQFLVKTNAGTPIWDPEVYQKLITTKTLRRPRNFWFDNFVRKGQIHISKTYEVDLVKSTYKVCKFCPSLIHKDERCLYHYKMCYSCGAGEVARPKMLCVTCKRDNRERKKRQQEIDRKIRKKTTKRIKLTKDFEETNIPQQDANNILSKIDGRKEKIFQLLDAFIDYTNNTKLVDNYSMRDQNEMEEYIKNKLSNNS